MIPVSILVILVSWLLFFLGKLKNLDFLSITWHRVFLYFYFIFLTLQVSEFPYDKPESEDDYNSRYSGTAYFEGEDGELSWFNAGVRVGVGIGLSICLGVGIGVGLLARTYQGTTRNFRRRLP